MVFWFLLLILLYVLGAGLSGGAAGRLSMGKGLGILGASCVEASEARLRAADEAMICLFFLLLLLLCLFVAGQGGGAAGGLADERGHGILGASCVETSEASLRAADGAMLFLFTVRASKESKGKVNYIAEVCL